MWLIAHALALLAQAAPSVAPSFDPVDLLTRLGIGAVIAAPFIYLWRVGEAKVAARDVKIDELVDKLITETVPAMTESTVAVREVADVVKQVATVASGLQTELELLRTQRRERR